VGRTALGAATPSQSWRDTASRAAFVEWTAHGDPPAIQHMRIDHRRLHIFVPQPFLHRPDIVALLEQMRGNTVPQGMATDAFGEPDRTTHLANETVEKTPIADFFAEFCRVKSMAYESMFLVIPGFSTVSTHRCSRRPPASARASLPLSGAAQLGVRGAADKAANLKG